MTTRRITNHPVLGTLKERREITFQFNGESYVGYEGDTIASALLANGIRTLRKHEESGNPRGIYCNIGHCYECRVAVDGAQNVRACLTPIKENMNVASEKTLPHPLDPSNEGNLPKTYAEYVRWEEKQQDEKK